MIESGENPKDRFFRDISGPGDRKIFFSKIWLRHILGIIILRQCTKFHEKISSTARTVFPAKIGCSGDF